MVILDRFHEKLLVPAAAFDGVAVVFVFEDHWHLGPEELRHIGVVPRIGIRLHQYAVVTYRYSMFEGVVGYGKSAAGGIVSGKVVGYAELCVLEVAQVEVYDAFLCVESPRMPVYG